MRKIEVQEKLALEYLASAACNFMVELCEEGGQFFMRPAYDQAAIEVGDFEQGQQFWSSHRPKKYSSPFEAATLFVNAVRVWEQSRSRPSTQKLEAVH